MLVTGEWNGLLLTWFLFLQAHIKPADCSTYTTFSMIGCSLRPSDKIFIFPYVKICR
jgi:hypothetical protein